MMSRTVCGGRTLRTPLMRSRAASPGMFQSMMTRCGGRSEIASKAASPSVMARTTNPDSDSL